MTPDQILKAAESMKSFMKVRFVSKRHGATAELVVPPEKTKDIQGVSRLYPNSEAMKMGTIQISPEYPDFFAAFTHNFDEAPPIGTGPQSEALVSVLRSGDYGLYSHLGSDEHPGDFLPEP